MKQIPWIFMILSLFLLGCGQKNGETESSQRLREIFQQEDRVLRIAYLQTWLADFPEAENRPKAYREIWDLWEAGGEGAQYLAWARGELRYERNPESRATLRELLFFSALENGRMEEALRQARLLLESGLQSARPLNRVAWALVADPGLDPELGCKLAEQGTQGAGAGYEKASILDTAGWGYFRTGDLDKAKERLEEALEEMAVPDPEISEHLEKVYERQGDSPAILKLLGRLLQSSLQPELESRARALLEELGMKEEAWFEEVHSLRRAKAKPAPNFQLEDLNGKVHHLADYRGKVVLLNFWHPT
ncbi:MAG: redoxin domain-containing protein [Candidatus Krumholzibacteria bacterium]|nr:redoxin domain-containing protein [Candidatus Krumholzibacteria bacterium]MDP6668397.1 redoxin domain-containing protein [Candidatus Krumholzibacteria bacterium]MDP6797966.1 redoxin domain-containing protein [Candidatus Krumholzibacteria bacterium]MDP7021879.1 redoxin domain-containing protein [Candidatus Krumholzibacteria bacterium]